MSLSFVFFMSSFLFLFLWFICLFVLFSYFKEHLQPFLNAVLGLEDVLNLRWFWSWLPKTLDKKIIATREKDTKKICIMFKYGFEDIQRIEYIGKKTKIEAYAKDDVAKELFRTLKTIPNKNENSQNSLSAFKFLISPDVDFERDSQIVSLSFESPTVSSDMKESVRVHTKTDFVGNFVKDLWNKVIIIGALCSLIVCCFRSLSFLSFSLFGLLIMLLLTLFLLSFMHIWSNYIRLDTFFRVIHSKYDIDIQTVKTETTKTTDKKEQLCIKVKKFDPDNLLPGSEKKTWILPGSLIWSKRDAYLKAKLVNFGQYIRVNYVIEKPDVIGAITSSDWSFFNDTLGKAWFDDCCSRNYPPRTLKAPPEVHLKLSGRLNAKLKIINEDQKDENVWARIVKKPTG